MRLRRLTRIADQGCRRRLSRRASLAWAVLAAVLSSCTDLTRPEPSRVPAALLIISGDGVSATVGTELDTPLTARVVDADGNPVAGQVVNFRVTSGGGSVFAGSSISNRDGLVSERWTLGTSTAEIQTVEARAVDNATGAPIVFATFHASALPDVPDTVAAVSGTTQSAAAEMAFPDSLLVRVVDRFGNPVPGTAVAWSAPAEAGTLSRTADVSSATGHASAKLTAGAQAGVYTVSAVVSNRPPASFSVSITAGAAAAMLVHSGDTQTGIAGTELPLNPAVRVVDRHGNPVAGVSVTFLANTPAARNELTAEDGIAGSPWRLATVAGPNSMVVSSSGLPSITFNATGVAGPPSSIVKSTGDGQTVLPGTAAPIRPAVHVRDTYGNPAIGAVVHFFITSPGGTLIGADAVVDANGIATVGSWIVSSTKGPNTLAATVAQLPAAVFTATAGELSPNISVFWSGSGALPESGRAYGDVVPVRLFVQSLHPLASVRATIGAAGFDLAYNAANGTWSGAVNISSEPIGTLMLVVTARDVNGAATDGFRTFRHDRVPTLTVGSPLDGTVARPTTDFAVTCTDDDPAGCAGIVVVASDNTLIASGTSQITQPVSLARYDRGQVTLSFRATDRGNQLTTISRRLFVESSPHLSEIVSGDGEAMDIRGDRALFLWTSSDNAINVHRALTIHNAATNATEVIMNDTTVLPQFGFVTPAGAIFRANLVPGLGPGGVMDSRNGDVSLIRSVEELKVGGDYATLVVGRTLFRRDLATGTDLVVDTIVSPTNNDVAANGDVVYWTTDNRVFRYRNGTSTQLSANDGMKHTFPVTDGINVVYRKSTPCCDTYRIVLNDGAGEVILTPDRVLVPLPRIDYAVNGGWTAFTTADGNGVLQIWTRAPGGTVRQISFFGTKSVIDAIGTDGTVIFQNGGRRYRVSPTGTAEDIMSSLGKVKWQDNRFVVFLGRTVFALMR